MRLKREQKGKKPRGPKVRDKENSRLMSHLLSNSGIILLGRFPRFVSNFRKTCLYSRWLERSFCCCCCFFTIKFPDWKKSCNGEEQKWKVGQHFSLFHICPHPTYSMTIRENPFSDYMYYIPLLFSPFKIISNVKKNCFKG